VYVEFELALLTTGEIVAIRRLKDSDLPGYDDAVERAIRHAAPFPLKRDVNVNRTVIIRLLPID
jgi:hypothetical protein